MWKSSITTAFVVYILYIYISTIAITIIHFSIRNFTDKFVTFFIEPKSKFNFSVGLPNYAMRPEDPFLLLRKLGFCHSTLSVSTVVVQVLERVYPSRFQIECAVKSLTDTDFSRLMWDLLCGAPRIVQNILPRINPPPPKPFHHTKYHSWHPPYCLSSTVNANLS